MYISIASYRDSFLQSTIDSAFCNADNPENLIVGCFISVLKEDPDANKFIISNDYNGRVKSEVITAGDFFSVTKCRNKALQWLLPSHEYVLQIDSHTRFEQGWDSKLINSYKQTNNDKCILSCYIPGWWIDDFDQEVYDEIDLNKKFYYIDYNNSPSKKAFFSSYELVPDISLKDKSENAPVKTWGMCGHFIFSNVDYFLNTIQSEWIQFWGEELYASLVAFTSGWDVYYPEYIPIRHLYPQDISENMSIKYFNNPDGPNRIWKDFSDIWFNKIKDSTDKVIDAILEKRIGESYLGDKRSLDDLYKMIGYDIGKLIESWRDEYRNR